MRAYWTGAICFELMSIPVKLYSVKKATKEFELHQLRASDLSRVRLQRIAEATGEEVSPDQIVKGVACDEGHLILSKADLERIKTAAPRCMEISHFVDRAEVTPIYFDKVYYAVPEPIGKAAYLVFRDGLIKTGKVAVGHVVMLGQKLLAVVAPCGDALILQVLHYAEYMVEPKDLKFPTGRPIDSQLSMMVSRIRQLSRKWQPKLFKDQRRRTLRKVIAEKQIAPNKSRKRRQITLSRHLAETLKQVVKGKN